MEMRFRQSLPNAEWASRLPVEEIPAAQAHLAGLALALAARQVAETQTRSNDASKTQWMLTVEDLEERTGQKRRWLFANAHRLPFIKRISLKRLRGDETLLNEWLSQRRTSSSPAR
jgi:hypothetical protein